MSKNQELQVHVEVNGIDEATKKLKDMSKLKAKTWQCILNAKFR